jgi:porin
MQQGAGRSTSVPIAPFRVNLFHDIPTGKDGAMRLGLAAACLAGSGNDYGQAQELQFKPKCGTCHHCPKKGTCRLLCSLIYLASFSMLSSAMAQHQELPAFQLQENKPLLQGSAPAVSENNPATVAQSTSPKEPEEGPLDASGNLLGDIGSLRIWLYKRGFTLSINEVDELWDNATGGTKQRPAYNGVTAMTVTADLGKVLGIRDGLFNISGLQIHGHPISMFSELSVFNPTSGFEAMRSTRLFEMWYQQGFFDNKFDIKIGEIDLDTEFIISQYASLFLNASFGWPLSPSINLYSGGPSWPLASPAVRLRYRPNDELTLMFAAADDNPTGHSFYNFVDPSNQTADPGGTNFNLGIGALLIGELQYAVTLGGGEKEKRRDSGLPGIYRLGGFYDTAAFPDEAFDTSGQFLASPYSNGYPMMHKGNWMVYGIVDQMLWHPSPDSPTAIGFFMRPMGNGRDRNVLSFSIDAGFTLKAPFQGCDNDTVGVGWGIGLVSSRAQSYDIASTYYCACAYPIRSSENHFELTYQAQVTPWLVVQPDFQYIWNPGGGIPNETTGTKIGNEAIFGVHASTAFQTKTCSSRCNKPKRG